MISICILNVGGVIHNYDCTNSAVVTTNFFMLHYMYVPLQFDYNASSIMMQSLFLHLLILRLASWIALTNGTVANLTNADFKSARALEFNNFRCWEHFCHHVDKTKLASWKGRDYVEWRTSHPRCPSHSNHAGMWIRPF